MASADGAGSWTFVKSKRTRAAARKSLGKVEDEAPRTRTTATLSVADIRTDFQKFSRQWMDSDCCRRFKDIINARTCQTFPRAAICLGLGSFDPEDGSWQIRRRSHVQLAAFRTLVECLEKPDLPKIHCIFQEPCFTDADKEFLTSLDYDIVDSPQGFDKVTEDSIVFGIHLYRDIYSSAVKKSLPAMFIGTGFDVWERYEKDLLTSLGFSPTKADGANITQLCRYSGSFMGANETS